MAINQSEIQSIYNQSNLELEDDLIFSVFRKIFNRRKKLIFTLGLSIIISGNTLDLLKRIFLPIYEGEF